MFFTLQLFYQKAGQHFSHNVSGVKEVLREQNLDGAKRSLLHRVIRLRRAISSLKSDKTIFNTEIIPP